MRSPTPTPPTSASTTSPTSTSVPGRAKQYGAELARLVDCRAALVEEGLVALQCGAFHIRSGGRDVLQHDPARPGGHRHAAGAGDADDDVDIWGDGSTYKGNDIERFYRYGLLVNPNLRIYKPWLDAAFVDELGGRAEMSEWLTRARPARTATAQEKAYSTDANIWGATHEAKSLEHLDDRWRSSSRSWACAFWDPASRSRPRTSRSRFDEGWPVAINGATFAIAGRAGARGERDRRAHGLGMSDQIENRIIEAKSRGIYEAPGMALLHIGYERLVNAIHNEDTIENYHTRGAASAACCTRAAGSTRRR